MSQDINENIIDTISTEEISSLNVPQNVVDSFKLLGNTVLVALLSILTMALKQKMQQLANYMTSYLENGSLLSLRTSMTNFQSYLDEIEKYKAIIEPYMKYLDIIPEVKKTVVNGLATVDEFIDTLRMSAESIKRLTYMNDFLSVTMNNISNDIIEITKTINFIKSLIQ